MKTYLKNLSNIQIKKTEVFLSCDTGSICIKIITPSIIHIDYIFKEIKIKEQSKKASCFISEPLSLLKQETQFSVEEEKNDFCLFINKIKVVINKATARISIYKNGILEHGGVMGDTDTVIPSYQLRVLQANNNSSIIGKFNFALEKDDEFYGLGDKTGIPNKAGKELKFFNRDSLGYEAANNDPLYKSIPFFIKANSKIGKLCGLLFDEPLIDNMNFGKESRLYYSVTTEDGPFSYYYLDGESSEEIINNYYIITGKPALPPLFTFGFLGSSMNYVEEEDAQQRILDYFKKTEEEGIPCEGMFVSSGYLKQPNGKRYSFIWNKKKFLDPKGFIESLATRGYKLGMNIKPGILTTHPWYKELAEKGYFIKDSDGKPYAEFYWGGSASFIDFNNEKACNWWKTQLKEQLLDYGCAGIWNDNNEFEIEDIGVPSYNIKSIMPMLMQKASYEICKENKPKQRPWISSRSGYAGMQRYTRTWSGDNCSNWETLRYNQYMGVGFGLSGIPYYGHDLGGFFGDRPEEELLIRSAESAVLQPRFVIHSWRINGDPTEPWTYQNSKQKIKDLIKEHYRFMPYIYNTAISGLMDRNLHLTFPRDSRLKGDEIDSMFGPSILKVLVVSKGIRERKVYLPKGQDWFNGNTGEKFKGGCELNMETPLGQFNWFAKEGSVIPISKVAKKLKTALFDELELRIFPGIATSLYFEDDGITEISEGKYNLYKLELNEKEFCVTKTKKGISSKERTFTVTNEKGEKIRSFDPDKLELNKKIIVNLV